jgi:hypothetical protein
MTEKFATAFAVFFVVLLSGHGQIDRAQERAPHRARVRTYFIATDEVAWDYVPRARDEAMGHPFHGFEKGYVEPGLHSIGRLYQKAIYREYMDAKFNRLVERSPDQKYLGILGPILYGEVGDTLKIFFKNNTSRPYSMHPHGLLYQKDSEGSSYNDGTSGKDKEDDAVQPGGTHLYVWDIPERAETWASRPELTRLALPLSRGRNAGHRLRALRRDRGDGARKSTPGWSSYGCGSRICLHDDNYQRKRKLVSGREHPEIRY